MTWTSGSALTPLTASELEVLANWIRVLVLCAVALAAGPSAAGTAHDPSTWGVYGLAVITYLMLERWFTRRRPAGAGASP